MHSSKGFEELAGDLDRMATTITNDGVKRRVLEAGMRPVVERAQRSTQPRRRTGRLHGGIITAYNEHSGRQEIGWNDLAFYGRFHEDGYRSRPGIRIRRMGKLTWKNSRKNPQGRTVQNQHIRPAYAAERETVAHCMIETYQNELGGT